MQSSAVIRMVAVVLMLLLGLAITATGCARYAGLAVTGDHAVILVNTPTGRKAWVCKVMHDGLQACKSRESP